MICPFVDIYIRRKAQKEHYQLPDNYKQILFDAVSCYKETGIKTVYSWLWDAGCKIPNASSSIPGVVLINSEWAFLLVTHYKDESVVDAFKMTMGHEMTHKENDYLYVEPFSRAGKFVYWVNEVHADYGGIVKAFEGDVFRGIRSMKFKWNCKGARDRDLRTHPSWKRRIEFVSSSDFDCDLINRIAHITGCKDQELINRLCNHYDRIVLKRTI